MNVCIADTRYRLNREHTPYPQRAHWLALLEAANQADSGKIAAECRAQGKAHFIAEQIDRARLAQIAPLQKRFGARRKKKTPNAASFEVRPHCRNSVGERDG